MQGLSAISGLAGIGLLQSVHSLKHFLRSYGQFPYPHAHCIVNRIGNGRGRRVDNHLADGFCAKGTCGLKTALKLHLDPAHIQTAGHLVLHEGILMDLSVL